MKRQLLVIIGIFLFGINSSFSYCEIPRENWAGGLPSKDRMGYAAVIGAAPGVILGAPTGVALATEVSLGIGLGVMGAGMLGMPLLAVGVERTVSGIKTIKRNRKLRSKWLTQGNIDGLREEFKKSFEKFKKRNKRFPRIDRITIDDFSFAIRILDSYDRLCNKRGLYLDKNKILKKVAQYIQTDDFWDRKRSREGEKYFYSNTSFRPERFIDPRSSKCFRKIDHTLSEVDELELECLGTQIIANPTKGGYYCGDVSYKKDKDGSRKLHIRAINTSNSISSTIHRVCRGVIQDKERSIKSSCNHLKLKLQVEFDDKNAEIDKESEKFQTCLHIENRDRSDAQAAFNLCQDKEYAELKLGSAKEEMGALYDELKSDLYIKNLMISYSTDKQLLGVIKEQIQEKLAGKNKEIKLGDDLRITLDEFSADGELLLTHTIFFDRSNNLQIGVKRQYDSKCKYLGKDETPEEICSSKHPQESKVDFKTYVMDNIGEGCIETRYEYLRRFTVKSNGQKEIRDGQSGRSISNRAGQK